MLTGHKQLKSTHLNKPASNQCTKGVFQLELCCYAQKHSDRQKDKKADGSIDRQTDRRTELHGLAQVWEINLRL